MSCYRIFLFFIQSLQRGWCVCCVALTFLLRHLLGSWYFWPFWSKWEITSPCCSLSLFFITNYSSNQKKFKVFLGNKCIGCSDSLLGLEGVKELVVKILNCFSGLYRADTMLFSFNFINYNFPVFKVIKIVYLWRQKRTGLKCICISMWLHNSVCHTIYHLYTEL